MDDPELFTGVPGLGARNARRPGDGPDDPRRPDNSDSSGGGQNQAEFEEAQGAQQHPSGETADTPPMAPEDSTFFATAWVAPAATITTSSDGDLWPSTWADDDHLYSACGDGLGFATGSWSDIVVNRIHGTPQGGLSGTRLAAGRDVAPIWTDPQTHNSKPTGMIAVDGNQDGRDELYLAVQDLRSGGGPDTFNIAPAAGIVSSEDYGRTWRNRAGPMFTGEFTTVMFLDFGRSNSRAAVLRTLDPSAEEDPAGFVYAYGLDHNWRTSYSAAVPDPTDLYLARVPAGKIEQRSAWEFYAGTARNGRPQWSHDLSKRRPVLTDTRRRGLEDPVPMAPPPVVGTRIAQGGVVYNPGLSRFLYTSWSEYSFEFYEAPTPWGPWRHFLSRDFGPYPWTGPRSADAHHGGYATTVPSKFIRTDGRQMWVQSNWFVGSGTYTGATYGFSLRPLTVAPASNIRSTSTGPPHTPATNLATLPGTVPIARAARTGHLDVLNDGDTTRAEDSWNGLSKVADYWGYTWPEQIRCTHLIYTTGPYDHAGGWFTLPPRVQIRRGGTWHTLDEVSLDPPYPADRSATGTRTYTFTFPPVLTTGIRLVGPPGGWSKYTAISELAVYDGASSASHEGSGNHVDGDAASAGPSAGRAATPRQGSDTKMGSANE